MPSRQAIGDYWRLFLGLVVKKNGKNQNKHLSLGVMYIMWGPSLPASHLSQFVFFFLNFLSEGDGRAARLSPLAMPRGRAAQRSTAAKKN